MGKVIDRSRRAQLQRMLGDTGTVLEYQWHGTPQRLARGWYAELFEDGRVVFLGEDSLLGAMRIRQLYEA